MLLVPTIPVLEPYPQWTDGIFTAIKRCSTLIHKIKHVYRWDSSCGHVRPR